MRTNWPLNYIICKQILFGNKVENNSLIKGNPNWKKYGKGWDRGFEIDFDVLI